MKKTKLLLFTLLSITFSSANLNAQLALDLAGPGNYSETSYNLNDAGFTLEYDMYMHTLTDFNGGVTFTCGNASSPIDFYVNTSGMITSFVGNCSPFNAMNPAAPLATGTWYNIAYVYQGGGAGIELYIDGVLIGTHAGFGYNSFFSNGTFRIGTRVDDATNADAKFDNIRIWSIPRTGAEVLEDMTNCFSGNETGLDILYKMEEGSGTSVNDLALANGAQDGTIVGTATWSAGKANPVIQGGMMNISACDSYDSPSGNYTWSTSGTYEDTIPSIAGCDSIITINLLINSVTNSPSISDDVLCMGDTTMLSANSTIVSEFYIGDPNTSGLNDDETYPCVYGNYYEGAKHQILVLASELTAMGMSPGEITGMEFYVDNINGLTDPLMGLTIKMGHTMVTDLDYTFETPTFVTTYNVTDFTVANGAMFHDFSTPFVWDGTSNIVIETCYNNDVLDYTENPSMLYTTTPFTSVSYYRADDEPTVCTEIDAGDISQDRPNFKLFGNTSEILWTNATGGIIDPTMSNTDAVPTASGQYVVDVNNQLSGCSDNDLLDVTVNANPTVDLGADISQPNPPVVLDAGSGFADYTWSTAETTSSISVSTSGTYYVTVTNADNCSATDTIEVSFTLDIVTVDGSLASVKLYPNPTSDFLTMDLSGFKDETLTVELIDLNGKVSKSFILDNVETNYTTQFDLSEVNVGVYMLRIKTSTDTYSHRVVVNK